MIQTIIDFSALLGTIVIGFICSKFVNKFPRHFFPRCLPRSQRNTVTVCWIIGLLAFFASGLATLYIGIPQPAIHDEFSYLLAADTFTHGRLANPTHPLWEHFETIHVIQQPTYVSKYPPAQGLMLAFGQFFFECPIVGVWLSVALACAATCWMLAGWCPLRWAWLGGLITVVRLVLSGPFFSGDMESVAYWSQSYWGGAVAALGGALVFGALPRIMKNQTGHQTLWLGLGLAILANSRPFEGLVSSIPVFAVLAVWIVRSDLEHRLFRLRTLGMPLVLVLLLNFSWMMYYNFRVTGDPFRMAYQEHESTYAASPVFLWQPLKVAPDYRHQMLSKYHIGWFLSAYQMQKTFVGWMWRARSKIKSLWLFSVGILFTPFMVALPNVWRYRKGKFALGVCILLLMALLTETWTFPHYAAPVSCLVILIIVESLRQIRLIRWRGLPIGRSLVLAVLPMLVFSAIVTLTLSRPYKQSGWQMERADLLEALEQTPERHLVIVHYGPNHSPHHEWVYNRADIDAARVVWARSINTKADKRLIEYFQDRRIWTLEVDTLGYHLTPYLGDRSSH